MKIYHLTRQGQTGWDEVRAFVVVAEDRTSARKIASDFAGDEGAETWLTPALSRVHQLGFTATYVRRPGVVVRDYRSA